MSRVQLALNVDDLDAAVEFYSKLFATPPAKRRDGYANFAVANPPLKLVLFEQPGKGGTINHLGVEVESTELVGEAQARLTGEGRHGHRGGRGLLLRPPGQGLGRRAVGGAVGDLHGARGRGDARRAAPHRRSRHGGRLLRHGGRRGPSGGRLRTLLLIGSDRAPRPSRPRRRPGDRPARPRRRGSGIAAQRLSPGDIGLQLLENAAATAGALVAIILAVGPVSGAHLNPAVTLADWIFGGLTTAGATAYVGAQVVGGAAGAVVANLMFSLAAVDPSTTTRSSGALWLSEAVATFGLLLVVFGVVRSGRSGAAPFAVAAYIGAAYFATASTSFANPAVTAARTLSDTFAGIAWRSAPAFVAAQAVGALLAVAAVRVLYPTVAEVAAEVVVPHHGTGRRRLRASGGPSDEAAQRPRADSRRPHRRDPATGAGRRPLVRDHPALRRRVLRRPCRHRPGDDVPHAAHRAVRPASACAPSPKHKESSCPRFPRSCSSACTTPAAARWRPPSWDHHAGGRVHVRSAGSAPAERINPAVVAAMDEWGIDLSKEFPKPLTDDVARAADVIVTMGCGDACPVYPGKRYLD